MSVIIRLQNLPWSANALDIRNFFRGLSIPEGGVHIVGGELGDAFIAFSTDEDARQAMMLNGGKIKEIQVNLLLSSRSEMHKVIEQARQSVPLLTLTAPAPAPTPTPAPVSAPPPQQIMPPAAIITPFSAALGSNPLSSFGIPGIGNPHEIPQPAVIEPPGPLISPPLNLPNGEDELMENQSERKRSKEKDRRRTRSRSKSRDRDRKDRKRERRDRSRSRDRRRRDRSRSRDRRDRKRDRKERSRSRDRSPSRRSRDRRNDRKSSQSQERSNDSAVDSQSSLPPPNFNNTMTPVAHSAPIPMMHDGILVNGPPMMSLGESRFNDSSLADTFTKLQELGKKRNPNAFQGEQQNGNRYPSSIGRGGGSGARGGANFRRERTTRFEEQQRECCVAIRNAPNHTSYGDVRRFFPFMIDKHGIKMINDNTGRRTGNIFVRFCDPRSKQLALQNKVNELKGAQVVVEDLSDETYEAAIDSFLPFRQDNDDEDENLVIADVEDPTRATFNILKLTELPTFVKEHDLVKSFSEYSLLFILIKDCRVTRTKYAFVHFANHDDAKHVLENKDQFVIGRRQPTFCISSEEEFEAAKQSQPDNIPEKSLPMGTPLDPPALRDPRQRRQQLDNGPNVPGPPPHGPVNVPPPFFPNPQFPGQPQHFGATFANPQFGAFPGGPGGLDPRSAANNWTPRPPFPNQAEQSPQGPSQSPVLPQRVLPAEMENEPLDCVLMKGLHREATDRNIVQFLSDTGAVPARIHLMLDSAGLPSGDCFCEFRSTQEARQAVTKHGHMLDGNRITIDLVSRHVVEEALEGPKPPEPKREGLLGNGPPAYFEPPRGGFTPRGPLPPFRGRGGFERGGFDRGGFNRVQPGFDQMRGSFDQGRGGFDHSRGGYRGRGNWNERGGRGFDRGRGRGFGRGRGGMMNFENGRDREMRNDEEQDPGLEDFGAPGCVVSMENVPFRASVDDILSFFEEFELSQDDVIRRYNERGQPTGDARVAFRTPFDAQRALKSRQMNMIQDRRINLSIV